MQSSVLFSHRNQSVTTQQAGGKGARLLELSSKGFPIPKAAVLTTQACDQIDVDTSWVAEVQDFFSDCSYLAVRSSAAEEDGSQFSYAGQFETYLYVPHSQIENYVRKVLEASNSERVQAYRRQIGATGNLKMAVVIQAMVDADVSGVAFGIHPVHGQRHHKVINAVPGLGEGLVSGLLNADQFVVEGDAIQAHLTEKNAGYFFKDGGGSELREHLPMAHAPALTNEQILEISTILDRLYLEYHSFQDLEFSYVGTELYVLQTRPITTSLSLPDPSAAFVLWDNSNIIESYPGVTQPLTFSVIQKMYEAVYRQFASLLGVEDRLIEEEADTFARMLGLLQGRVYYNLLSWYKALSLVPGYSLNAAFMENMMGVKERFDLPVRRRFSRLQEYKRLLRTGWGIISNLRKLESNRLAFLQHVHTVLSAYKQKPWSTMDATQLWEAYLEFEHTLVKKWKAPLVNDFFAMIYFGVLQKLVLKYQLDTPGGNLHNDLVAGSGDIVSTEPIRLGLQLSGVILDDVQLRNLFQNHTPEHIYQQLKSPEYQGFYHSLQSFLDSWGDRCVGELKLETVTYNLEPERYIAILQEYVKNGLRETQMQHSGAQTLRAAAERKVQQSLKSFWKRLVWNHVLKKARYLISHRENLRYERTRGFGMVRKIFLHLGIRWQAEGVLHSHRDIFWLSISEIRDFVQGTSVHPDLKSLVELRKKMYATLEAQTLDERLRTYGPPYYANRWRQASREPLNEGDLKGIPCCAGLVKARVRVLHQPQHVTNLKGCILVTSSTDPGWAPLFPSCAGILVERGSLLSHSAIVSRELGIPCIVGIPHLLERLEDGQWVEMDGSTGLVRCIDEP